MSRGICIFIFVWFFGSLHAKRLEDDPKKVLKSFVTASVFGTLGVTLIVAQKPVWGLASLFVSRASGHVAYQFCKKNGVARLGDQHLEHHRTIEYLER